MKSTANPHNMHIGNRIARCRALRFPHMSKEKFCSYLCFYGLSKEKKFITRLEAGRRSIHDYELLILADALCVTVSDLLDSHSLDHLTPIEKKYPDSICAPPLLKNVSGIDISYYRYEILHQTQGEFAQTLNAHGLPISRSKVCRLEAGKISVYAHELIVISKVLGVSYDSLLM